MNKYFISLEKKDCCGCRNCEISCPVNCISMNTDEEGFIYPKVELDKCIKCGICSNVCPIENNILPKEVTPVCYAAISNNDEAIKRSSSGGVFSLLAEKVIKEGGVVFGAFLLKETRELFHKAIEDVDSLREIIGSKYIQSDLKKTFELTKKYLVEGKKVLFVGLGCQIAALKLYLQKAYDNLICVDLLCHGVPSPKMFKEYVKYLERKHKGKLMDINFRDKEKRGWSITLRYDISKKSRIKKHYVSAALSPYFYSFLRGYTLREVCYYCPYTSTKRLGDITLADFWGVEKVLPNLNTSKGCSLVLINTSLGKKIFEDITLEMIYYPVTLEQATIQNINFFNPTSRPKQRDVVYKELDDIGYNQLAKKYFLNPRRHIIRVKRFIPKKVLGLIKK